MLDLRLKLNWYCNMYKGLFHSETAINYRSVLWLTKFRFDFQNKSKFCRVQRRDNKCTVLNTWSTTQPKQFIFSHSNFHLKFVILTKVTSANEIVIINLQSVKTSQLHLIRLNISLNKRMKENWNKNVF